MLVVERGKVVKEAKVVERGLCKSEMRGAKRREVRPEKFNNYVMVPRREASEI